MPQIKLDILDVHGVRQYADRSVDVEVTDRVRGRVTLRMQEDTFRWFWAEAADIVRGWRVADGEE